MISDLSFRPTMELLQTGIDSIDTLQPLADLHCDK